MAAEALEFDGDRDPGRDGDRCPVTPLGVRSRPLHVFSGRLDARLDELADEPVWTMTGPEVGETLVELYRAEAKVAAMKARLLAQAERLDVAKESSATSTAAWLRGEVRLTPRQARDAVALARALETGTYPATAAALAAGGLRADQAQVVVEAVDGLPDWLFAEERLRAEAHLVELGRSYDARQLQRLGRHLLEVVDPVAAERELAERLAAEEAAAARATSFRLVDDGHGKAHGRFTVPSLHGQMLKTLLQGFANPQAPDPIPRTEERLTAEVMGDALVRLVESYPVEKVPSSGGLNATVVVTMPLETLTDGVGHATVAGAGLDVSAAAARRMACAAGVIPAVLDGRGRVLDLGRRSRLASPAQRLAKVIEQQGLCAIEHCDRPASWADAHHWKQRWVDGATTNLDDLALVCRRHHTLAHLPGRTMEQIAGGGFRIHHQT